MGTKLKRRIIPVIQYRQGQIVKSQQFKKFRTIGNLEMTIEVYNKRLVDELIILDIGVTRDDNEIDVHVLESLSRNCMMPVTYGGGVKSLKDIEACLCSGCDKVMINNQGLENIGFLKQAAECFGSQAIIAGVDYESSASEERIIFSYMGLNLDGRKFNDYIKDVVDSNVGEIMLTDVSREGMMSGLDCDVLDLSGLFGEVSVMINGGAQNPVDFFDAFSRGAAAVCASSIFSFSQYGYGDIKNFLSTTNPEWISGQSAIV